MGDRRNVIIEQDNGTDLVFYTHSKGSRLPETLAKALDRGRNRWTDPSYLSRIIFSQMVKNEVMSELGYGVESKPTGSTDYVEASPGYDPVVSIKNQTVVIDDVTLTFEEYIKDFS